MYKEKRRFYFSAIEVIAEIWEFYRVTAWGRLRLPSTILREVLYGFLYFHIVLLQKVFSFLIFHMKCDIKRMIFSVMTVNN